MGEPTFASAVTGALAGGLAVEKLVDLVLSETIPIDELPRAVASAHEVAVPPTVAGTGLSGEQALLRTCLRYINHTARRQAEREKLIFAASEIGLLRLDQELRITRVNEAAATLLRRPFPDLLGTDLIALFPGNDNRLQIEGVRRKLVEEQRSADILLHYCRRGVRCDDRIPVNVTLYPEFDEFGTASGFIASVRDSPQTNFLPALKRIHATSESERDPARLFQGIVEAIKLVVPFDCASLWVYDDAGEFARERHSIPSPPIKSLRWYPVGDWRDWLLSDNTWIDDLPEAMKQRPPQAQGIETDPVVQWYLAQGFRSVLGVVLKQTDANRQEQARAGLFLYVKQPNYYDRDYLDRLVRLEVPLALRAFIRAEEHAEREFQLRLMRDMSKAEATISLAETLVRGIADFFGWANVSVFKVNRVLGQFELLAQATGIRGFTLPEHYEQLLTEGLLSEALDSNEPVILEDTEKAEELGLKYKASNAKTRSELCFPITFRDRVLWILNLEDRAPNAFSCADRRALARIIAPLEETIYQLFSRVMLTQIVDAITDAVVVTDTEGVIRFANQRARLLLLGETGMAANLGAVPIREFCLDETTCYRLVNSPVLRNEVVQLKAPNGGSQGVIADVSLLRESYDHRVLIFSSLAEQQWAADFSQMRAAVAEVARETRVPLQLASTLVRRIAQTVEVVARPNSRFEKLAQSAIQELGRVELTYDRITKSLDRRRERAGHEQPIRAAALLQQVISELPEEDREAIDATGVADNLEFLGYADEISFVLRSLLFFLVEGRAPSERIAIGSEKSKKKCRLLFAGPGRELCDEQDLGEAVGHTRLEVALGPQAIHRILREHGGSFKYQITPEISRFELGFPIPSNNIGKAEGR